MTSSEEALKALAAIGQKFIGAIPHNRALNMEIVDLMAGEAMMRVPWDERFVGDPATGVLHGGVITALLDSCSGAAVLSHPSGVTTTATIDLRIDYMRPARPGKAITCKAVCYRATRSVAFVRGSAWDEDEGDLVAASSGAFTVERGGPLTPAAQAAAELMKKVRK
ncbi:PaaI family thioesterase [Rhodovulum sp. DZ06]|uniref:PaaI family thioesterase n=1 Tax=Rhodovulum sp. DZ06 TaxID=3425126 RepID=UPI003D345E6A